MRLFIVLIASCILLSLITTPLIETFDDGMKNSNFEVKPSPLLDYKERGLFATKDYKKGDVIETCPTLSMKKCEVSDTNIINEHLFKGNKPGNSLLSLGYCSIINHSRDKQNCTWEVAEDDSYIRMYAIKDIATGDEIYTNYGAGYWQGRGYPEL